MKHDEINGRYPQRFFLSGNRVADDWLLTGSLQVVDNWLNTY